MTRDKFRESVEYRLKEMRGKVMDLIDDIECVSDDIIEFLQEDKPKIITTKTKTKGKK